MARFGNITSARGKQQGRGAGFAQFLKLEGAFKDAQRLKQQELLVQQRKQTHETSQLNARNAAELQQIKARGQQNLESEGIKSGRLRITKERTGPRGTIQGTNEQGQTQTVEHGPKTGPEEFGTTPVQQGELDPRNYLRLPEDPRNAEKLAGQADRWWFNKNTGKYDTVEEEETPLQLARSMMGNPGWTLKQIINDYVGAGGDLNDRDFHDILDQAILQIPARKNELKRVRKLFPELRGL